MKPMHDLTTLSDDDLKALIEKLAREEEELSAHRRRLHGRIEILSAGTSHPTETARRL